LSNGGLLVSTPTGLLYIFIPSFTASTVIDSFSSDISQCSLANGNWLLNGIFKIFIFCISSLASLVVEH